MCPGNREGAPRAPRSHRRRLLTSLASDRVWETDQCTHRAGVHNAGTEQRLEGAHRAWCSKSFPKLELRAHPLVNVHARIRESRSEAVEGIGQRGNRAGSLAGDRVELRQRTLDARQPLLKATEDFDDGGVQCASPVLRKRSIARSR